MGRKVKRYYAQFPLFEEDSETVAEIVNSLGYELTDTMRTRFGDLFTAARAFIAPAPARRTPAAQHANGANIVRLDWSRQPTLLPADFAASGPDADDADEYGQRLAWLAHTIGRQSILDYGIAPDMWLIANLAEAGEVVLRDGDPADKARLQEWGWPGFAKYSGTDVRTLEAIKKRTLRAASVLKRMEQTNRKIARSAEPLPTDRKELVRYGGSASSRWPGTPATSRRRSTA